MKKILIILMTLMTAILMCTGTSADGDIRLYCGIMVPRADFDYPDNSEREYSMSEFDALFSGNSKERYFKSQIFIDEIFVRYGYNFSARKRAPGKVIYDKYVQADWYAEAIRHCPTQDQLTLMYSYMSSVERRNIENVNSWQQSVGITPFENPYEISWSVSPLSVQNENAPEAEPAPVEEASSAADRKYADRIRTGDVYEAKDFSGNGSTDTIQLLEHDDAQVLIFGKAILDLPAGAKVWYFHYDSSDAFLVIDSGDETQPGYVEFYKADGNGGLTGASEEIGGYTDVHISNIDKEGDLFFTTGYPDAEDSLSFRNCTKDMFRVTEKYYVNTEKQGVYRRSNYGQFEDGFSLKYIGNEEIALSTSGKEFNSDGPTLLPGEVVNFTRVYFKYKGSDASKGDYIYEIECSEGKGWFLEDESVPFSDDPEAPLISEAAPTPEPTPEVTPEPTAVPTPEPTPEPTAIPTPEVTPTPEPTAIPTPEVTPTPEPTVVSSPIPEPTTAPKQNSSGLSLADLIGQLFGGESEKPASSDRRREAAIGDSSANTEDNTASDITSPEETDGKESRRREASVKGGGQS